MIGFDGMGRVVRHDTTPVQDSLIRIIWFHQDGGFDLISHLPSAPLRKEAEQLIKNGWADGDLTNLKLTKRGQKRLEYLQKTGQ